MKKEVLVKLNSYEGKMSGMTSRLRKIFFSREVLWAVVLANLAGSAFGFFYYLPQFAEVSPALWVFVADSPIATLSIAVALIARRFGCGNRLLDGFAFVANVKYGLWTCFVLLFYSTEFMQVASRPMYLFLFFSHLAMAFQVILVAEKFEWKTLAPLAAWFLLNDTLDYTLGVHPYIYSEFEIPAMIAAYSLSVFSLLLASRVSIGTPPTNSPGSTSLFTRE